MNTPPDILNKKRGRVASCLNGILIISLAICFLNYVPEATHISEGVQEEGNIFILKIVKLRKEIDLFQGFSKKYLITLKISLFHTYGPHSTYYCKYTLFTYFIYWIQKHGHFI